MVLVVTLASCLPPPDDGFDEPDPVDPPVDLLERYGTLFDESLVFFSGFDNGLVVDSSVYGRVGSSSGVSLDSGRYSAGAFFSGAGYNNISFSFDSALGMNNAISVSAWVYRVGDGQSSTSIIVGRSVLDRSGHQQYSLGLAPNNTVRWRLRFGTSHTNVYSNMIIPENVWVHVVGTYDGSSMRLFVDGLLDNELGRTGLFNSEPSPLFIGTDNAADNRRFSGLLDEIAIYNKALTSEEVSLLHGLDDGLQPLLDEFVIPGSINASMPSDPFCGNAIIEEGEECDLGVDNGVVCTPPSGGSCTYCSNDCKIITIWDNVETPEEYTINGQTPNGLRAGNIRYLDSTMHSIAVEWDIEGDMNHNANSQVRFRKKGEVEWKEFMPLLRVNNTYLTELTNYARPDVTQFNMFAGSIMFLTPGTEYEIWLEIKDPDGGSASRIRTISTKPYPQRANGCTITVTPSTFSSAYSSANPGDRLCLQDGYYGDIIARRSGLPENYIVFMNAQGHNPRIGRITVEADYLWIEGILFDQREGSSPGAIRSTSGRSAEHIVVYNNRFEGHGYSINLKPEAKYWYIADNIIIGNKDGNTPSPGDHTGEGVEVGKSDGHTIAFNTISRSADGISYTRRNVDFFGNYVYRMTDDLIEPDYGYANNRFWGNRLRDGYNHALSFQPMYSGPWYFIRNEVRQTGWRGSERTGNGGLFKFNGMVDRFVLLHNTFVSEEVSPISRGRIKPILSSYSRNNLYIVPGSPVWSSSTWSGTTAVPPSSFYQNDWRTDVDYDGFAWSGSTAFTWEGRSYSTIEAFASAVGIQHNAIRINVNDFVNYPSDLRLRQGTPSVNSGDLVLGVNENHHGSAPDRGAYEYGKEMPHYGAGTRETLRDRHKYWEYW